MTSATVETKLIEADDNAFINTLVAEGHQEVYFRGWVDLFYEDKKSKKRILVVSSFRVYTIKVNMLGRSLRQQFPIRDLTLLKATEGRLHLEFAGVSTPAIIEHPEIIHIAQSVLFAYQSISLSRPKEELAKIEIAPMFLQDYLPPEPDSQDALLASYLCECEYVGSAQRVPVLDHLMTAFQMNHHTLNLDECLACVGSDTPTKDVQALVAALRSSDWFSELISLGSLSLKNEGVSAIAPLFSQASALNKLALINVRGGKAGFTSLAQSLSKGVHSLTYLNISHNKFEDAGLQILVQGLEESKKALHTLALRNCGVSGKGLQALCSLLSKPHWARELKVLDVSENRGGKVGTQALGQWLTNDSITLEQLHLSSCDLDLELFLPSLSTNRKLYDSSLKSLDLSGNKMSKKAAGVASALLATSGSLSQLQFSNCSMDRSAFASLLDSAFANERGLRFSLDFSHNDLGVKGARDLSEVYMRWLKKDMTARSNANANASSSSSSAHGSIHTLNLSECGLGVEGVVAVCKALSGTTIHTLALDCNLKLGLFSSGKEAGEAMGHLLKTTPCLKELSVAGDGNNYTFKSGLSPLLASLATTSSLTHLDISKNRIGDEGAKDLADALSQNESLISLHIDHNRLSIKGIRMLHSGLTKNKTLEDWILPTDDLMKIVKSLPDKKIRELQSIVAEFETMMDANAEHNASLREKEKAENKENKEKSETYNGYCSMRGTRQWLLLSLSPSFQHQFYAQSAVAQAANNRHVRAQLVQRAIEQALHKKSQGGSGGLELISDAMVSQGREAEEDDVEDYEDDEEESVERKDKQSAPIAISASPSASSSAAPASPLASPVSSSSASSSPPSASALPPPMPSFSSSPVSASSSPSPHLGLGSPAALSAVKPAGFSAPVISLRKPNIVDSEAKGSSSFADWKNTHFPLATLKGSSLPASVDPGVRELYLSDADFAAVFAMSKQDFIAMPKWKQTQTKQQHGLF